MPPGMLRMSAVIVLCFANAASAVAGERPRQAPAAERGSYVDPAAPYKADRLSSSRGQKVLDTPGQSTVLTREVLDDMKATSLKDALRSTAGVTIGR
jgi:outer membrane receptor for monomeric catechols